jgi:phosphotransferase system HPr-like phosphotransfer protein
MLFLPILKECISELRLWWFRKAYEIESMMDTSIYIRNQSGREVPATALMAIHSLNIKPGERITIVAKGANVTEAIDCFEELLRRDLLPQNPVE